MTRDYHKHNQVVISVVSDVALSLEQAVFFNHSLKFIHLYFFQYFFFPNVFLLWNSHVPEQFDSFPQITELVVNFFFSLWMISTGLSLSS